MRPNFARAGAFTLIELLIVVAIVALLAAVAVPNFLEAQARARVGRELSDLRALGTALEAYALDHGRYPPHGEALPDGSINFPAARAGIAAVEFVAGQGLTTPVAYLSSLPDDPCLGRDEPPPTRGYGYVETRLMAEILLRNGRLASAQGIAPRFGGWRLYAAGPDGDKGRDAKLSIPYDPTNGTVSNGDLLRSQHSPLDRRSEDE